MDELRIPVAGAAGVHPAQAPAYEAGVREALLAVRAWAVKGLADADEEYAEIGQEIAGYACNAPLHLTYDQGQAEGYGQAAYNLRERIVRTLNERSEE